MRVDSELLAFGISRSVARRAALEHSTASIEVVGE
jgi:hypothetical protein